jgi:hypothetical protein
VAAPSRRTSGLAVTTHFSILFGISISLSDHSIFQITTQYTVFLSIASPRPLTPLFPGGAGSLLWFRGSRGQRVQSAARRSQLWVTDAIMHTYYVQKCVCTCLCLALVSYMDTSYFFRKFVNSMFSARLQRLVWDCHQQQGALRTVERHRRCKRISYHHYYFDYYFLLFSSLLFHYSIDIFYSSLALISFAYYNTNSFIIFKYYIVFVIVLLPFFQVLEMKIKCKRPYDWFVVTGI